MFKGVSPQGAVDGGRWAAVRPSRMGRWFCAAPMASEAVGFQEPDCELPRTDLAHRHAGPCHGAQTQEAPGRSASSWTRRPWSPHHVASGPGVSRSGLTRLFQALPGCGTSPTWVGRGWGPAGFSAQTQTCAWLPGGIKCPSHRHTLVCSLTHSADIDPPRAVPARHHRPHTASPGRLRPAG